jgi:hypothetical protein
MIFWRGYIPRPGGGEIKPAAGWFAALTAHTLRRLDFASHGVTLLLKREPMTFLLKQYTGAVHRFVPPELAVRIS